MGSGLEIHCYILMKYLNTSLSPALIIARASTHFEEELLTSVICCTTKSILYFAIYDETTNFMILQNFSP